MPLHSDSAHNVFLSPSSKHALCRKTYAARWVGKGRRLGGRLLKMLKVLFLRITCDSSDLFGYERAVTAGGCGPGEGEDSAAVREELV